MSIVSASTNAAYGKELTSAISPLSMLFISEMLGGLFLAVSFGLMPMIRQFSRLSAKKRHTLLLNGIITGIVGPYLWFAGLERTTAINSGLFSQSHTPFLILLSALLLGERVNRKSIAALSVICFGILCVGLEGFQASLVLRFGDLLIIASSMAYAVGWIFVKKDLHHIEPELIIFARAICATALFFALSPFTEITLGHEMRSITPKLFTALMAYGLITKFFGIYGFNQAIDRLRISTVSSVSTLGIVGAMAFSAMYLGEYIHWYQLLGAAFIVYGVLMMQRSNVHKTQRMRTTHMMAQNHRHHHSV